MKKITYEDTIRLIQEIVAHETGRALSGDAVREIKDILLSMAGDADEASFSEKFFKREVTIMLTDLRGFASRGESFPTGMVIEQLNRYLTKMSEIIIRNRGTIDKFMGDAIMVVFGLPYSQDDHVRNAMKCAVEMQIVMDEVNAENKIAGVPELYMGIGINTGSVMAGTLGSDLHSEYTIIGDEVDLASCIEAFSLRGQILISEAALDRCRSFVTTGEAMDVVVKGKAGPVNVYEVLGIPSLGLEIPRRECRRSPRVEVSIPFTYRIVANTVISQAYKGTIMDIGYHGILAKLDRQFPANTEILMELDMSLIGYKDANVRANILNSRQDTSGFFSGIEFTSVSVHSEMNIKRFVQLLIQGKDIK
jgi:adenylate cyclase